MWSIRELSDYVESLDDEDLIRFELTVQVARHLGAPEGGCDTASKCAAWELSCRRLRRKQQQRTIDFGDAEVAAADAEEKK